MHCGEHVGAKLAMQRTSLPYVVALDHFFHFLRNFVRLAFAVMLRPKAGGLCVATTLSCKISALPFGQCRFFCIAISDLLSVLSSGHIKLENAAFSLLGLLATVSFEAAHAGPYMPVAP